MHKWFDELQEPMRFAVFIFPAILLIAGKSIPYYGINVISLALMFILAISRIMHIHNYTKTLITFINKTVNICRGGQ